FDSLSNGSLIFSVGAAVLYLVIIEHRPSLPRSVAKTLAVALLAVLALLEAGPPLLVAALVFCAVGDAFLSREGDSAFLGGLGSFLIGHVVFVVLFAAYGEGLSLLATEPARLAVGAAMVVAAP